MSGSPTQPYTMLIGGAGFIGQHLIRMFQQARHYIHVVDPVKIYGNGVSSDVLFAERRRRLELVERNCDAVTEQVQDAEYCSPDVIVYLAGVPRHAEALTAPVDAAQSMITDLIRALEIAARNGVRRFVYVSSSMVYGDFAAPIREEAPLNPIGIYATLKRSGEELVKDFAMRSGFEYVIVRPTAVYGPGDLPNRVVPRFFERALQGRTLTVNGRDEVLDFTYVTDTARGIFLAATVDGAENDTYNISYGTATPIYDVAAKIVDLLGEGIIEVKGRQANFPSRHALDITKAQDKLGYRPEVDINTGLKKLNKWLTFQTLSKFHFSE